MIVTCPACNTQFNADPALFGPAGRKVRCARCAHVWRVGPDGLPLPEASAPQTEPPVPAAEVPYEPAAAAAGTEPPAPAEPAGEAAAAEAEGGLVMSARELLEREEAAGPSALPPEAAAEREAPAEGGGEAAKSVRLSAGVKEEDREARGDAEQAALAKLAAKRAEQRGKRKKGGRKFQIFLLVLCLVVIALLAVAHFTGRFGPGGDGGGQGVPTVGNTPPPRNTDGVESKPAEGGHIIGGKE